MKDHSIEYVWQGPQQCHKCGIRHLVLFADLQRDDFAIIHKPIEEVEYLPGESLYEPGTEPNHVYTIRQGLVKLVQFLPDGNQRIVRLLKQGDAAGLEVLVGQPYQHTARVLESVSACQIPSSVIVKLSEKTPRLHQQLMARWQRAVNQADTWLTELSTGPARTRFARLMLLLQDLDENGFIYLPSREDIGAMLGITTETASRITAEFKREGHLEEIEFHRVRANITYLERIASMQ